MGALIGIAKKILLHTPFEVRRRPPVLPAVTLDPLDLILALFESLHQPTTIVQIGACDGVTNDPVHAYIAKGVARGILLEPNPYAFERLQKTYKGIPDVTLLPVALAEVDGEVPFYRFKKTRRDASEVDLTLQLASFYKEHLLKHLDAPESIEQITVACRSLRSLTTQLAIEKIDLLQIDTEGFDAAAVFMALQLPTPPDVINFEHLHIQQQDRQPLFDQLAAKGYLLGWHELNCVAVQLSFMQRLRGGPLQCNDWAPITLE